MHYDESDTQGDGCFTDSTKFALAYTIHMLISNRGSSLSDAPATLPPAVSLVVSLTLKSLVRIKFIRLSAFQPVFTGFS